ncbi:MAG: outer membrane lipoprotein-sorting protein [Bacteroidota bacterium]
MQKSKSIGESTDQVVTFTLDLVNAKGKKRTQKSEWHYHTSADDVRSSLFRFLAPADVKGTGFLSVEYNNRDDDRWLYLPVLGRSRRISSNEKSDRFMGSDFTYEDLERVDLVNFEYELLKEDAVEGETCYVVKSVPNNPKTAKESGYGHRIYYVSKSNSQFRKIEYYNKKNQLSKFVFGRDIRPISDGSVRAYYLEMTDVKSKHKSIINFANFQVNTGVSEEQFTVRNLEKS